MPRNDAGQNSFAQKLSDFTRRRFSSGLSYKFACGRFQRSRVTDCQHPFGSQRMAAVSGAHRTRPPYAVARYVIGSLEVRLRYATWRRRAVSKTAFDGTLIPETSFETLRPEDPLAKRVDAFGAEKPTFSGSVSVPLSLSGSVDFTEAEQLLIAWRRTGLCPVDAKGPCSTAKR
jgi:hypothetical protein